MFFLFVSLAFAADLVITPTAVTAATDSVAICQAGASDLACQAAINDPALTKRVGHAQQGLCPAQGRHLRHRLAEGLRQQEVWKSQGVRFVLPGATRTVPKPAVVTPAGHQTAGPRGDHREVRLDEVAPSKESNVSSTSRRSCRRSRSICATPPPQLPRHRLLRRPHLLRHRETAERLKAAEAIVEDAGYDCSSGTANGRSRCNRRCGTPASVRTTSNTAPAWWQPEVSPSRHTYGKTVDVSLAPLPAFGGDPMPTAYDSALPDDDAEDKTRARPPMPGSNVKPELWSRRPGMITKCSRGQCSPPASPPSARNGGNSKATDIILRDSTSPPLIYIRAGASLLKASNPWPRRAGVRKRPSDVTSS